MTAIKTLGEMAIDAASNPKVALGAAGVAGGTAWTLAEFQNVVTAYGAAVGALTATAVLVVQIIKIIKTIKSWKPNQPEPKDD